MQQAAIFRLPLELLTHIARNLKFVPSSMEMLPERRQEAGDLRALALSSKTFYEVVIPVLWKDVYLSSGTDVVGKLLELADSSDKNADFNGPKVFQNSPRKGIRAVILDRVQILDQSDRLAAMVRSFTIQAYHVPYDKGLFFRRLERLIRKMPRLQSLCLREDKFHSLTVIAALCAREESQLEALHMSFGPVAKVKDFSVLQDLKLTRGRLRQVTIASYCGPYPKVYLDAVSRILSSSVQTIEEFRCYESGAEEFLGAINNFPALKHLCAWNVDLASPCFASAQPNVEQLEVLCKTDFLDDIETLLSFRRRFPLLKKFILWIQEDEHLNAERLSNLGKHLLADAPHLSALIIRNINYLIVSDSILKIEKDGLKEWGGYATRTLKIVGFQNELGLQDPRYYTRLEKGDFDSCTDNKTICQLLEA